VLVDFFCCCFDLEFISDPNKKLKTRIRKIVSDLLLTKTLIPKIPNQIQRKKSTVTRYGSWQLALATQFNRKKRVE
jgi:hypothetical protein